MVDYDQYPRLRTEASFELDPDTMLQLLGPEHFTEALNVPAWIQGKRVPETGRLDITSTAELLGVPLKYERLHGAIKGQTNGINTDEPLEVILDALEGDKELTFGHEIGHLMLDSLGITHPRFTEEDRALIDAMKITSEIRRKFQHRNRIEGVCDRIGLHYALPIVDLIGIDDVDELKILELMDEYGTTVNDTIYQLVRAGKLPRRFKVESRIKPHDNNEGNSGNVDFVCFDCRVDFGSCEGQPNDELVLDFNDFYFGGMFEMCKSLAGQNRRAV